MREDLVLEGRLAFDAGAPYTDNPHLGNEALFWSEGWLLERNEYAQLKEPTKQGMRDYFDGVPPENNPYYDKEGQYAWENGYLFAAADDNEVAKTTLSQKPRTEDLT